MPSSCCISSFCQGKNILGDLPSFSPPLSFPNLLEGVSASGEWKRRMAQDRERLLRPCLASLTSFLPAFLSLPLPLLQFFMLLKLWG